MTPRGGPTLDFSLFGRYFLDLAVFYPGAFLCLAPLWEHVKAPRRTAVLAATLVTVICLAAAALCAIFELDSNILLLPTLLAAFWLLRRPCLRGRGPHGCWRLPPTAPSTALPLSQATWASMCRTGFPVLSTYGFRSSFTPLE